ncbi:MAG: hypothetical protein KAH21_10930 [Spirochaetaceae bacterium]|nr:hypothetical protein [Spirochaetaceae bacterium]
MKKWFIVFILSLTVLSFAAAEEIDLGEFPVGEWLDAEFDALWTFSSDNIQLFRTDGTLVYDFKGEVEDFNIKGTMSGIELSFSCTETNRAYKFIKGVTNTNLKLVIDTVSGVHYEKEMKMQ